MFGHGGAMRIDASNLLVAAQAQLQRPASPAAAGKQGVFQPPDFAKLSASQSPRQAGAPSAVSRPGTHLDIKV
jgi:hypothetical protein